MKRMYQAILLGWPACIAGRRFVQVAPPSITPVAGGADPARVLRLIHERLGELARSGYRHHPVTAAVRDDERAARGMSCPECLHRGLHFIALAHPRRTGHVALAWCDLCRVAVDVKRGQGRVRPAAAPRAARA